MVITAIVGIKSVLYRRMIRKGKWRLPRPPEDRRTAATDRRNGLPQPQRTAVADRFASPPALQKQIEVP